MLSKGIFDYSDMQKIIIICIVLLLLFVFRKRSNRKYCLSLLLLLFTRDPVKREQILLDGMIDWASYVIKTQNNYFLGRQKKHPELDRESLYKMTLMGIIGMNEHKVDEIISQAKAKSEEVNKPFNLRRVVSRLVYEEWKETFSDGSSDRLAIAFGAVVPGLVDDIISEDL